MKWIHDGDHTYVSECGRYEIRRTFRPDGPSSGWRVIFDGVPIAGNQRGLSFLKARTWAKNHRLAKSKGWTEVGDNKLTKGHWTIRQGEMFLHLHFKEHELWIFPTLKSAIEHAEFVAWSWVADKGLN